MLAGSCWPAIVGMLMGKLKLLMPGEPPPGLAPLLVEQNTNPVPGISYFGHVLEIGKMALQGDSSALRQNPRVKSACLGG
jgi:ABC-type branched-subunit amino acid transport system ATPase component